MSYKTDEYFGSPADVELTKRAELLWSLLKNDGRFAFFGRLIFLNEPGVKDAALVVALAKLSGSGGAQFCPAVIAEDLSSALTDHGLNVARYEQMWGTQGAIDASRRVLESTSLPEDLTEVRLTRESSSELVAGVGALSTAYGVMPVGGEALRGVSVPGVCLAAVDRAGEVVSTASAHICSHPASKYAHDAFWGKLATREDRRGQRIGLWLGAKAIVSMAQEFGAKGFFTGVNEQNASSMKLCEKLSVTRSNFAIIASIDPAALGDATFTR